MSARFWFVTILLSASVWSSLAQAAQGPQTFTLDGYVKQTGSTNALKDSALKIKVQIMDPTKQCLLYEEEQTVDTMASGGYFSILVGSDLGSSKRTADDSGLAMYQVFQNSTAVVAKDVPGQTCTGGMFTPITQDYRYMRITVTPSGTGVADVLSPDTVMDAVPAAVVAEWAESVGGFTPNDLLQVNAADNLTQTNLENLFAGTGLSNLQAIAAGNFMPKSSTAGATLPSYATGTPPTTPVAGSMWYDSGTKEIKYYDGSATQIVGTGGGSVTEVKTTTNLTVDGVAGGTITSSGTLDLSNTGVTASTYPKVTVDAKGRVTAGATLVETDIPTLTGAGNGVEGDAIQTGTIGGNTVINTTGNITTTGTLTAPTVSSTAMSTRQLDIWDSDNSNRVRLVTPATGDLTTNYDLTLPVDDGTSGQVLATNGAGTLSWITPLTGSTGYINGGNGFGADASIGLNDAHRLDIETDDTSRMTVLATGEIGIGTTDPKTLLEVAGTVKVGDGGETCAATYAGGIRYNGGNLQFCNGTAWSTLGVAGSGITALTGDVTASGSGSVAATIANDAVTSAKILDGTIATSDLADAAVTYAKIQDVTDNRLLGRSAGSDGDVQEIQVGTGLTMSSGTLALTDTTDDDALGGVSCNAGEVPKWNGTAWSCQPTASANTNDALVLRDSTGNFAANVVTANGLSINNAGSLVDINTPAGANYSLTLPADDGDANQVLATDGAGVLTWTDALTSGSGYVNGGNTFGGNATIGLNDAYRLDIETGGSPRLTVTNGGRVGIGTTNPGEALEVVGKGVFSTNVTTPTLTSGTGSNLAIVSGPGPTLTSPGTNLSIAAGGGGAAGGVGGTVTINGGTGGGGMAGGPLILAAGSPSGGNVAGAATTISGGRGGGTGDGGALNLFGGDTSLSGAGAGGAVNIQGGDGQSGNPGGAVNIAAGNAGGSSSDGANVTVTGGKASGTNKNGGNVLLFGGDSTGSGVKGNVGIDVVAPVTKLDVAGTIKVADGGETCSATYAGGIRYNSGALQFCNGTAWTTLGTGSGSGDFKADGSVPMTGAFRAADGNAGAPGISFASHSDTGFYLDSFGNLNMTYSGGQIATVDSNGIELQGSAGLMTSSTGGFKIAGGGTSSASTPTYSFNNDTHTGIFHIDPNILGFTTDSTERMRIDADGNVGIGTTDPSSPLVVVGNKDGSSTTDMMVLQNVNGAGYNFIDFLDDAGTNQGAVGYANSSATYFPGSMVVATGTGIPMIFATNVSSERMRIADDGKVGIGITNPAYALDVAGDVNVTGNFKVNGVNLATGGGDFMKDGSVAMTGTFKATNGTAAAPSITFDSDPDTGMYHAGNNSIGFSSGGFATLEVYGGGSNAYIERGRMKSDGGLAGNPSLGFAGDSSTGLYLPSVGELGLSTAGSEQVRIDAVGNVGIGTTDPTRKLDVRGSFAATGNTGQQVGIISNTADDSYSEMTVTAYDTGISFQKGIQLIANSAATSDTGAPAEAASLTARYAPLTFSQITGGSTWFERMRIDMDGNVGIGTTDPGAKLDIVSGQAFDGARLLSGNIGQYTAWSIGRANTDAYFGVAASAGNWSSNSTPGDIVFRNEGGTDFIFSNVTAPIMTIQGGGNVGIGTTDPGYKLDVGGIANATQLCIAGDCKSAWPSGGGGSGWTDGGTAVTLTTATDSVGIGGSPSYKLDVTGDINTSTQLRVGTYPAFKFVTGSWNGLRSNAFIGTGEDHASVTGDRNIAVGTEAGRSLTSGGLNTLVGYSAGGSLTDGPNNTFVGNYAAYQATSADSNVGVGAEALSSLTTGMSNIGLAYGSGGNLQSGDNNIFIGMLTGGDTNNVGDMDNNVAIGYGAGGLMRGGSSGAGSNGNILLGYQAGDNITIGDNNIVIGYNIDAPSATGSNTMTLGNLIYGTGLTATGTTVSTGKVGIGTTNPAYTLDVNGITNATQLCIAGDCKSAWPSGGGGTPAGSSGQIQFNGSGSFAADNALFWDNTDKQLGIGIAAPTHRLHVPWVSGDTSSTAYFGSSDGGNTQTAVEAESYWADAIRGTTYDTGSTTAGVKGVSYTQAAGVVGSNWGDGFGLYAASEDGTAGYFTTTNTTPGNTNPILIAKAGGSSTANTSIIEAQNGSGTPVFKVATDGQVGIGVTAPAYALDVDGDINVTGNFKVNGVNLSTGGGDFMKDGSVAMTGALKAINGTAANPGYTFSDDDTGMYYASGRLSFSTNGLHAVSILGNGRVGIGTSNPSATLEVISDVADTASHPNRAGLIVRGGGTNGIGGRVGAQSSSDTYAPFFLGMRSRGTVASPTQVQAGDSLGYFGGIGYGSSGWPSVEIPTQISIKATEAHTSSNKGAKLHFLTTPDGEPDAVLHMVLDQDGKLGLAPDMAAINPVSRLDVRDLNQPTSAGTGIVGVFSTDAQGADLGGSVTMGGQDGVSSNRAFAQISGRKSNSTSGNYDGYMVLATRPNGGNMTERMRIAADGKVGVGVTNPAYALDVAGDVNVTGNFKVNGVNLSTGGGGLPAADGSVFSPSINFTNETSTGFYRAGVSQIGVTTGGYQVATFDPLKFNAGGLDGYFLSLEVTGGAGSTASSPAIRLTSDSNTGIYGPTADTIGFSTGGIGRLYIDAAGNVGIGTTNPAVKLDVSDTSTSTALAANYSSRFVTVANPSADSATLFAGSYSKGEVATGNARNFTTGLLGATAQGYHRGTGTVAFFGGANGEVYNSTTGTITEANGVQSAVTNKVGGSIANAYSTAGYISNQGTGTITNAADFYAKEPSNTGGGQITNYYGLYIENPTAATHNYSIYSAGGTNYFAGKIGIGTTAPGYALDVAGDVNVTGNFKVNGVNLSTGGGSGDFMADGSVPMTGSLTMNAGAVNIQSGGSAASPAISIAGNGGIFSPAASTIAFNNGTAEAMRISAGNVGIGTTGSIVFPGARLAVNNTGTGDRIGQENLVATSSTSGSAQVIGSINYVGTNDIDGGAAAIYATAQNSATDGGGDPSIIGIFASAQDGGAGTTGDVIAGNFTAGGEGVMGNIYGLKVGVGQSPGSAANVYGLQVNVDSGAGVIDHVYGVQIPNIGNGADQWAFYQDGADDKNYFAGNVGIGVTNPSYPLQVEKTSTATTGQVYGAYSELQLTPSTNQDGTAYVAGNAGTVIVPSTNTRNLDMIVGFDGYAENNSTGGTANEVTGARAMAYNSASSANVVAGAYNYAGIEGGSVATARGSINEVSVTGGTLANVIGQQISLKQTGGSISNRYGIFIDTPTGTATNDFGIYQVGTQKNYFAGNIGIGVSPTEKLEVNGNVKATSFISTSDARLKRDIASVDGLSSVEKLRGVTWTWKSDGTRDMGVIAQEVEKVFPWAVVTDPNTGYKAVKYNGLIAPMIEATKELAGVCQANAEQLAALQAELNAHAQRLDNHDREIASLKEENTRLKQENAAMKKDLDLIKRKLGL